MIVLCCYWYGYYFDISFLWFFISEMIIGRILAIMNDSASSSFPVLLFSISFCTWWVLDFFFSTICVVYRHWFLWLSIYLSLSYFIAHCLFLKISFSDFYFMETFLTYIIIPLNTDLKNKTLKNLSLDFFLAGFMRELRLTAFYVSSLISFVSCEENWWR